MVATVDEPEERLEVLGPLLAASQQPLPRPHGDRAEDDTPRAATAELDLRRSPASRRQARDGGKSGRLKNLRRFAYA